MHEMRCVVCHVPCDETGLCDDHKYDDQPRQIQTCPRCMKPLVLQHRCEPCCEDNRVVSRLRNIMGEYHTMRKLLTSNDTKAGELHNLRKRTLAKISQALQTRKA